MDAFNESSNEFISNDELMLKELERRDGIYSFIFHELEAPKEASKDHDQEQQQASCSRKPSIVQDFVNAAENFQQPELNIKNEIEEVSSSSSSDSSSDTTSNGSGNSNRDSVDSMETIETIGNICDCSQLCVKNLLPAPVPVPLPPCTLPYFQNFMKPWNPPPTLVYDYPQLYAYMANWGFRVRVAQPSFSDFSTPLVRNRRHALKDTAKYKRYGVRLRKIPDLRWLFPFDPDVHAPFGGLQSKQKRKFKFIN